MPLIIESGCEGGRVPPRWAERKLRPLGTVESYAAGAECVRVAFINNMPDAALEDTEMQFFELLEAASEDVLVCVSLFSLPGVARGERGQQHLSSFYSSTNDLFGHRFHGMIMTGTEPKQANLRNEPYWPALATVLDWAENHTVSAVLSCLAAHAGVLYSDGINRHPLSDKQFGVFAFDKVAHHQLTDGTEELIRFPHSRWNEVRAVDLAACGYTVLTQSAGGGVDSFTKKKKRSLFVCFQGHPEYDSHTLLKEYRRDIKRFVRGERETYPTMPEGYFDVASARLVAEFRDLVRSDRREELIEGFPEAVLAGGLQKTWRSSATTIYRNWLRYVASKPDVPEFSAVTALREDGQGKRSAFR
ncbi:MAG TPA: homoserine O-succinyltransferase [Terriglobales bacterium]|jgi:homoserine O-succinyltransferase|nr:homoserine O-succinyltransferase [Terriglobales bacterium]